MNFPVYQARFRILLSPAAPDYLPFRSASTTSICYSILAIVNPGDPGNPGKSIQLPFPPLQFSLGSMRITSRAKTIAFFITMGSCLVGAAVALNVSWILLNWRRVGLLVLGVIFFGAIIAGLVLNTIFLVREMRRNDQQDSFLNAVTHELKTPLTSIRLYLQTLV